MIRVISLGAGVQSSTMALMADRGLFGERPDFAIFADTGNEPKAVYIWLKWLVGQLSFPVRILSGLRSLQEEAESMLEYKKGDRAGSLYWRNLIPYHAQNFVDKSRGLMNRKCTSNFKIRPIVKILRRSVHPDIFRMWRRMVKAGYSGKLAESWIGISTDEAVRMKPSRDPWIAHRWPLIEAGMTRADCLRWMSANGYPPPPKSACTFCPYHSDAQWLEIKREDPEAFQEAIEHERRVQAMARACPSTKALPFLHRSCRPLDSINFEDRRLEDGQGSLVDWFNNECEGMCGN